MGVIFILKDGFTVGNAVYRKGDIIEDYLLADNYKTPAQQREYYGDVWYSRPEKAERYEKELEREEQEKADGVKVVTANVQVEDLEEIEDKPKKTPSKKSKK